MKNFVKYAAVGVAGYLIGFYEMKYKVMKVMTEAALKDKETNLKAEEKEEETN